MQQEMINLDNHFKDMVLVSGNQIVTTSIKVSEYFGKRHSDVIRKIKGLMADHSSEFGERNFALAGYIDEQGKPRPMYELTKDGWLMLVMGFTGPKAAAIREAYIKAFNWMAEQLTGRRHELMNQHNEACLEFRMEKGVASLAGMTLNRWKSKKPILNERITLIERQMQIPLLLS